MNPLASLFKRGRSLTFSGQNALSQRIAGTPRIAVFPVFLVFIISLLSSLVLAEEGATYTPENDRIVQTDAAGKLPIEKKEDLAQQQIEHWNKVEENTGKEISYSYVVICDRDGHCMKVDPPKFVRFK